MPLQHHLAVTLAIGQMSARRFPHLYAVVTDANLSRSRAELAQMFLNSEMQFLLFIDSDITFTAEDVLTLERHELPIVGGTYRKREPGGVFTFVPLTGESPQGTVLKVWAAGTGFLMIRRDVIESVNNRNPHLKYNGLHSPQAHAIFDNIIDDDGTYLSTDFSFCSRARECGYPISVDLSLNLGHVGYHNFRGDPLNVLLKKPLNGE